MHMTRLGKTDLHVSPIAFGTWRLGGDWGAFDEPQAIAAIRAARARGINRSTPRRPTGSGAPSSCSGERCGMTSTTAATRS